MGKPVNAYLAKMQAQHAKNLQDTATLMKIWAIQAMTDAIMLGLMRDSVTGKIMNQLGEEENHGGQDDQPDRGSAE